LKFQGASFLSFTEVFKLMYELGKEVIKAGWLQSKKKQAVVNQIE
jgi:hypothetical protein